jgi:hypothetical protein
MRPVSLLTGLTFFIALKFIVDGRVRLRRMKSGDRHVYKGRLVTPVGLFLLMSPAAANAAILWLANF